MASRVLVFGLVVLVLASVARHRAAAQPSACTPALASLAPCFNFLGGNATAPTSACCSQLAGIVQASPRCLCSVLNGTGAPSLGVPSFNQTLALALPGACNVTAAPLGQCNAVANAPSPASVEAPEPSVAAASPVSAHAPESSNQTPAAAATPSSATSASPSSATSASPPSSAAKGGSKSAPSTNGSASDRRMVYGPLHLVLLILFLVTFKGF